MRIAESDLEEVFLQSEADLGSLRDARIFITGGTGFLGKWLIEFFTYARSRANLNIEVVLLSRNSQRFLAQYPELREASWLSFVDGDVRNFRFPDGDFSHIIHAATDVAATISPLETFDVTVLGTRRVLELASQRGGSELLLVSSGAVYGVFPEGVERIRESSLGQVDVASPRAAYGLGKLTSEWLANLYSGNQIARCKSARLFTHVGPHLDLNAQFAVGNFIRDFLKGEPLTIKGDGSPIRSYMYGSDLIVWLLRILVKGKAASAYNVGSEEGISIKELANVILSVGGRHSPEVQVLGHSVSGAAPNRYLPDTKLAQKELGLSIQVPLKEAIEKTINWHRSPKT